MTQKKNFWFKFEWAAWLGDKQLHRCSLETRGFWVECLAVMYEEETFFLEGTIEEIANLIGCSEEKCVASITQLQNTNAANITKSQDRVKIVSRRILKQFNLREYNRLKKQEERERLNVNSASNAPSKIRVLDIKSLKEEREERKEKETDAVSKKKDEKPKPATAPATPKSPPRINLPEDFKITPEMRSWAQVNTPNLKLDDHLPEFIIFWIDIASKNNRRTLRGWQQTWRNRMTELQNKSPGALRNARNQGNNGNYQKSEREKSAQRRINADELADRLEREANAELQALHRGTDTDNLENDQPGELTVTS